MGINMDIRNEPEYEFLDLRDLDDTTKNEILEILRQSTGLDNSNLPWDIGDKQYELATDISKIHIDEDSNQWQDYGTEDPNFIEDTEEDMISYNRGLTILPMIPTAIPPGHHYGGGQMIHLYSDSGLARVGHPFANSTSTDPNAYPIVGEFSYGQQHPMFATTTEMMKEQPIRDNERQRGGGRGRGSGNGMSGKRESYNRPINSNSDTQTSYAVQTRYGQMMPSGAIVSFGPQGHPPPGTQYYMPRPNSGYSQGLEMSHTVYSQNSHPAFSHHSPTYQTHQHSLSNANYRGSQGHATYYNQETRKNPAQKHHDKRGYHEENCPAPGFRNLSNLEADPPKRTHGKSLHVGNSNANLDVTNNSVNNNSTAKHTNPRKAPFSSNDDKFERTCEIVVKEKVVETVVEIKKPLPAAVVDNNNTVVTSAEVRYNKDKVSPENEVSLAADQKSIASKVQPEFQQSPPITSEPAENVRESKEPSPVVKKEEPQREAVHAGVAETPSVPLPSPVTTHAVNVTATPPPVGKSWASVVLTGASPGDSIKSPPPIPKLSGSRVVPVNCPPASPSETAAIPKISTQEINIEPRNYNVLSSPVRNNAEPVPKSSESSPWAETKLSVESPQRDNLNDPAVFRMGELLLAYQMDKQTVSLLPRGLTNRSNYCYINSILQALLACPPFYNLLMALPHPRNSGKNSSTPLIDNMARFVREFSPLAEGARLPRKDRSQKRGEETAVDVQFGVAFEPSYVYTMLKNTSCAGVFSVEGRQEDAEEFLSCLLNGISDEMLELMKLVDAESNDGAPDTVEPNVNLNNDEEGWKVMGPKNKGSITRCTEFGRTPLSDIFRGQLRSRVIRVQEESTDNVQPFFTLQLDIEKAESVEGALETLFGKDRVEGMTCSKTKQQIEAWKQVSFEELPVILILHLKWFDYKLDGCSKIVKRVGFPIDLKLDSKKLLSPNLTKKLIRKQNHYKLFAVTYHDGKEASKGHYVTDAFHVGYGAWVRYDDSSVKGIYEMDVLNPSPPRVPYLLYYRRCDTIGNNPPNNHRTR